MDRSPFVKDLIANGYRLEFSANPPSRLLITSPPRDRVEARALGLAVGELSDQKAIIPVPPQEQGKGFYSHVFVVKKRLLLVNSQPKS